MTDLHEQYTKDLCDSLIANLDKASAVSDFIAPELLRARHIKPAVFYGVTHLNNKNINLMCAAAAAIGRLDVFTNCIGDQEPMERTCFPFKNHLCAAVATGKFNIIEHKLSEMEVQPSKVAEDDEISARQIALGISNACSMAIECQQRAYAKILLTFLARNEACTSIWKVHSTVFLRSV